MRSAVRLGLVMAATVVARGAPCMAQAEAPPAAPRPYVAGVCQLPPYSFRQPDGNWDGMAPQLWKIAVAKAGIQFEWRELPIDDMQKALEDGSIDVGITGFPIVPARVRRMDFSQPFEAAGLVIVTRASAGAGFVDGLRRVANRETLAWLIVVLGATMAAAILVALFERRRNPQFPRGIAGIGEGLWWSITTMSTVGYGDRVPITRRGRLTAAIWMVVSFGLMTVFSGIIAASITVGRLNPLIEGPEDLQHHTVGVLAAGSAKEALLDLGVTRILQYDTPERALDAVRAGTTDAVVGESTVLRFLLQRERYGSLLLLPHRLQRSFVGLGLSRQLPGDLRATIDQAVVETVESAAWSEYLQRLLGSGDA